MPEVTPDPGQQLLLRRERKALLATMRGRAMFAAFGVAAIWVVSGELSEKIAGTFVFLTMIAVSVFLSRLLLSSERLQFVGLGGALMDSLMLCALPLLWHLIYTSPERPIVHLLGHNLGLVSFMIIILNGAALRPAYPALVTVVAATLHLVLAVLAVNDPRLDLFPGGLEGAVGLGMGVRDPFLKPVIILLGGGVLVWITAGARRMLQEAVEREQREQQMRQEQMQMVLQAQVSALGQLVAGVEHEVNSPLGAVRSSADTAARAVSSLREALASGEPGTREAMVDRAIRALDDSVQLTVRAGRRLTEVMATIKRFVHLDRAERQAIDVASCVEDASRIVEPAFGDSVRLRMDLQSGLIVHGDGARLAQAFATVVQNAAEAIEDTGTVRVSATSDDHHAVVEVADDGRGMTDKEVAELFEIDFVSGRRVRARFGLAACRSVVHGHGGDIQVRSRPGEGTIILIRLPMH